MEQGSSADSDATVECIAALELDSLLRLLLFLQASVAGALSRDVIFARVAPATYALKAHIALRK